MAHRKGHFDSTTFRRMKDKFNEEQLESNDSDIVGGKLDFPQFSFRGKDAYNTTMQAADGIGDPYSYDNKRDANDKKYPLLSSRHHTGDFYNPMQTTDRRSGVRTREEEKKAEQDRMASGSFVFDSQGTRGLSYFGDSFDKVSEKQAKIANERAEYLRDIALNEGEEELYNALDTKRMVPNKNGVMINRGRLVNELFPMGETRSSLDLDGGYAANPAGQSLRNIDSFTNLSNRAIDDQDEADYYRDYFGKRARQPLRDNYFDTRGGEI